MKKKPRILGMFFIFIVTWLFLSGFGRADVEWSVRTQLKLEAPPLDVSESADGKWLFILTPREILIYSIAEDKLKNRIPVDRGYDRLIYSARNNTLILTSRSEKAVKVIQREMIHKIDISGLPFKGPDNAPIIIAVFSDYQ